MRELWHSADRRYRYPFTNCTACGPRLTIVRTLPYDRPNTTMAAFEMCAECCAEYDDPEDRRLHAEPIACPACGPRVSLALERGFLVLSHRLVPPNDGGLSYGQAAVAAERISSCA